MPYIGNIHREVCPIMRLSCLAMHPVDVNNISMHQPVRPQIKKFCNRLM
jgi:hypothetical protein